MNFIAWMIVACEVAFWIVIILGLAIRYIFKKNRLSIFFFALTPLIDLLLLVLTSYDLYRGATATIAHGIAAIYIGVSVAYGKSMINWADSRFRSDARRLAAWRKRLPRTVPLRNAPRPARWASGSRARSRRRLPRCPRGRRAGAGALRRPSRSGDSTSRTASIGPAR